MNKTFGNKHLKEKLRLSLIDCAIIIADNSLYIVLFWIHKKTSRFLNKVITLTSHNPSIHFI
jgi:hypothetical protein